MKKMKFYTTFDSDMEYHYNNFIIDNMHEEMDCAPPMFKSNTTKLGGRTYVGSCSRRRNFNKATTRSSYAPPSTSRWRHKKATRQEGQPPSTSRWRNKNYVPPPMQEEAKPSKKAKPRHPNDFRRLSHPDF